MKVINESNPSYAELAKFMMDKNLITANEARALLGLDAVAGGDINVNKYKYNQDKQG